MNVNNENKLQELSLYVNINLNNMNIQKQQNAKTYNKDNNSLINIIKIKRNYNLFCRRVIISIQELYKLNYNLSISHSYGR